jgi:hypothetical protein
MNIEPHWPFTVTTVTTAAGLAVSASGRGSGHGTVIASLSETVGKTAIKSTSGRSGHSGHSKSRYIARKGVTPVLAVTANRQGRAT